MKKAFWNFPKVKGGDIHSINDSGIETFRDNPVDSLAREICQNSLDAIKDETKPVIVEFNTFTTTSSAFPLEKELKKTFEKCQITWQGKSKKSEEFSKNAIEILNNDTIPCLRISDFNTKGLEGAKKGELTSPWSSLVKERGTSNKGDSSGGSFGIGKAAPFLNSKLRTLFYSSMDLNDYRSHIGVAKIMSFTEDSYTSLGTGYYTNSTESLAIPGLLQLDKSFVREESGTDIFVTAFYPTDEWVNALKYSVLHNFFMTIYHNRLVVKINGEEINKENIHQYMNELNEMDKENRILRQYFHLIQNEKALAIPYPAKKYKHNIQFKEGEATLLLVKGDNLNRRVFMTRATGMRLFEQKNISGTISFTGILQITGKNMNEFFKELENPNHNDWSPNRFEKDPKEADKIFGDLRRFIRNTVKEHFQDEVLAEMDAAGISDFLPNTMGVTNGDQEQKESLTTKVKQLVKQEKQLKKKKKKRTKQHEELADLYESDGEGTKGGNGDGKHQGGKGNGAGVEDEKGSNNAVPNDKGEQKRKEKDILLQSTQRVICLHKEQGKYKLLLTIPKSIQYGRFEFFVMGEQSNFAVPITNISSTDLTVNEVMNNKMIFTTKGKKKKFELEVTIPYNEYCVMEVDVYEN